MERETATYTCPQCRRQIRTLADEAGDHGCSCGWEPNKLALCIDCDRELTAEESEDGVQCTACYADEWRDTYDCGCCMCCGCTCAWDNEEESDAE